MPRRRKISLALVEAEAIAAEEWAFNERLTKLLNAASVKQKTMWLLELRERYPYAADEGQR